MLQTFIKGKILLRIQVSENTYLFHKNKIKNELSFPSSHSLLSVLFSWHLTISPYYYSYLCKCSISLTNLEDLCWQDPCLTSYSPQCQCINLFYKKPFLHPLKPLEGCVKVKLMRTRKRLFDLSSFSLVSDTHHMLLLQEFLCMPQIPKYSN